MASPIPVDEDWQLVPGDGGLLHLVDINAPEEIETNFNAVRDMRFFLFTRSNPTQGHQIILNNAATLANSHFNAAHPTRFLIHGWNGNHNAAINPTGRDALLSRGNFNVIVVDWGAGAQTANYVAARNRVGETGVVVASFMDWINQARGLNFATVSAIGFSLGAHVAGFAGKRVTRGRLASIIGLDAALPLFTINNPATRLAATDAIYVETIHTNAGLLGFDSPLGQTAFYPNFGRNQPGCGIDLAGSCAHDRAVQFYVESVRFPTAFWGTRCDNFNSISNNRCPPVGAGRYMGGDTSLPGTVAASVFHLTTNNRSPFGQGR